ncbi:hypothetical protein AB0H76_37100 [Nocardia sp. NPDC050712]|uniref:hypothetical protein n=1 Tax=Nocardia sp. NPDC050712 TaxID=3155518 RepID=UPI0033F36F6E
MNAVDEQQQPEQVEWTAAARSGAISVRTTEQGLPLGITVEPAELQRDPRGLAEEVLRLCKSAAAQAGLARRAELEARGASKEALALMGLPTPEEVSRQEYVEEQEYETEQQSWLRPI